MCVKSFAQGQSQPISDGFLYLKPDISNLNGMLFFLQPSILRLRLRHQESFVRMEIQAFVYLLTFTYNHSTREVLETHTFLTVLRSFLSAMDGNVSFMDRSTLWQKQCFFSSSSFLLSSWCFCSPDPGLIFIDYSTVSSQ